MMMIDHLAETIYRVGPVQESPIMWGAVFLGLIKLGILILVILIAWRAMRAHESLAESARLFNFRQKEKANTQTSATSPALRDLDPNEKDLYAEFLRRNPRMAQVSPLHAQVKFQEWLAERQPKK